MLWRFFIASIVVLMVQQNNACFVKSVLRFVQNVVIKGDGYDEEQIKLMSINDETVSVRYWNSECGNNKSIKIKLGHEDEIRKYWIPDLPLKVIIHGWFDSTEHMDGVFCIKTAYLDVGGYNVISVDWGGIAGNKNYMLPVLMTSKIGSRLARMLENIVRLKIIQPKDIHLIGHSLGAHIAGVCGSLFKVGRIGRITGLDPAGPGFEFATVQKGLKISDALFVDVIHTSGGSTGYLNSMGHADFYPNGGGVPQPGCYEGISYKLIALVGCSHSRAYRLYEDSVYNSKSMMAVECPSWGDFKNSKCKTNYKTPMGHGASPEARGDFYLKTVDNAPFGIFENNKEDL